MKVFLSWSGERSRLVATALHDWLPFVINDIEPFLSSNIDAGARWQSELAAELEKTDFGIVCVTAENRQAPWLNFEAGALAKKVGQGKVVPLAVDLHPTDISNPLGQFQALPLTQEGMSKIVATINTLLPAPLPKDRFHKVMGKWWPELESQIQTIDQQLSMDIVEEPTRSDRELLEDILGTVRSLARKTGPPIDSWWLIKDASRSTLDSKTLDDRQRLASRLVKALTYGDLSSYEVERLMAEIFYEINRAMKAPEPDKSSDG